MSIPGSASPLLLASTAAAAGGLQISRSIRFNSADSATLSRTPAVAGNRQTWTWSGWVKRVFFGQSFEYLFDAGTADNFGFTNNSAYVYFGSGGLGFKTASAVFRDPSAWMHYLIHLDSTNATAEDRCQIWINGVRLTSWSSNPTIPLNFQSNINSTVAHTFANAPGYSFMNTYLTNIHFIDGQALTPSSFTETDATTGQLIPKTYTGSYGTNGFNLLFADNSSNTASTLGKDTSGNSNNWTPNNLSVTAGVGNDSLVDSPTNGSQSDTGVGGEVRGNYATLNPLANGAGTLTNGNLDYLAATSNAWGTRYSTIGVSSGKWYAEFTGIAQTSGMGMMAGVSRSIQSGHVGSTSDGYGYRYAGDKYNSNSGSAYGASYTDNDVIGVALDLDNGTLVFYKNGASQGTAYSSLPSGTYFFGLSGYHTSTQAVANFGQRAFAYTAPSGFKALCTQNLPAPLVTKSNTVFDVALWTGDGGSTKTITGLGFNPDFIWTKQRNQTYYHQIYDVVRGLGVAKAIASNADTVEGYGDSAQYGYISSTTADGFIGTAGTGTPLYVNQTSTTYVGWCWDAGTSTVSNTAGSITSQVRANATAGFSVVTATKTSGTHSVGHGLGVTPGLIIVKNRAATSDWIVAHSALNMSTQLVYLNKTDSVFTSTPLWGGAPTSSVFYVAGTMLASNDFVAYCFAPVVGYSNGFSYTGNGSTDGVFVYLGMRPKLLLIKRTDTTGNWYLWDTVRNTYNVVGEELYPNLSSAAATATDLDILSNGFKMRSTAADFNASGGTYVGFAWAESPFNYSRAR